MAALSVLILVVVGRGLVHNVQLDANERTIRLNPCCSWTWTSTSTLQMDLLMANVSLNPCCSWTWTSTSCYI